MLMYSQSRVHLAYFLKIIIDIGPIMSTLNPSNIVLMYPQNSEKYV